MIQQVNLYQEATPERPFLMDLQGLILLLGGLALFAMFVYKRIELENSTAHARDLEQQVSQASTHMQQLQAKLPLHQPDTLLEQTLANLQTEQQGLNRVLTSLADDHTERSLGFSAYLSALAEQAANNVWLTGFKLNSETGQIVLQGAAFKPEPIAALLQRLQRTEAFKGRTFASLKIQQIKNASDQLEFSVSSDPGKENGKQP